MERDTFMEIIEQHQNLIFKICCSYCYDSENRKDLQQEILIQLWNSFSKFDGRVKMSTWIYKVALNTAIFYYRKDIKFKSRRASIETSIITLSDFQLDTELNEKISMLYKFIEHFNEMDRGLIILYLDGNKYKDIADVLGISESNVATKINRIKNNLKKQFHNN